MSEKIYFCDPVLYSECTKEGCFLRGGPCYCTKNTEFAMKNQNGNPVECIDSVDENPNKSKLDSWLDRFQFEKQDWNNEFK